MINEEIDSLIDTKIMGYLDEFSSNIKHAWDVVEILRADNKVLSIAQVFHQRKDPYWEYIARIEWHDSLGIYHHCFAIVRSAPRAICLAAIESCDLKVEVKKD